MTNRLSPRRLLALAAGIALAASHVCAHADDLNGAGSTFVAPVIAKWAQDYEALTGTKITYQSVGSGAGIEKIKARDVDFGASDKPLTPAELKAAGLCQFPIVVGGVVPVINLPGLKPGEIKFTGALLADIYLGKITMWNAPQIKAVNRALALPALPIFVTHRSDRSGTTFNFLTYLSNASAEWKRTVGAELAVDWPTGAGREGNDGVADAVAQTEGAIGYVEYTYALQKALTFGQVQNAHNLFVSPNGDTFQAAAATVDWKYFEDFSASISESASAPDAYPITATTFVLMDRTPGDTGRASAVLGFFKWALEDGGASANALHYVELPPSLVRQVEDYWSSRIEGAALTKTN